MTDRTAFAMKKRELLAFYRQAHIWSTEHCYGASHEEAVTSARDFINDRKLDSKSYAELYRMTVDRLMTDGADFKSVRTSYASVSKAPATLQNEICAEIYKGCRETALEAVDHSGLASAYSQYLTDEENSDALLTESEVEYD